MRSRRVLPLTALTAAGALVAAALTTLPAQARPPAPDVTLTLLGTYDTGLFDEGGSEITAYDPATQRLFVVNSGSGTVDVVDIAEPSAPTKVGQLEAPGANSVAVHDGLVAVAEEADDKTDPGTVAFHDAATLVEVGRVTVGALPDMVTFTRSGDRAVVANEGEPEGYCDGQVDPEGSVSVIDLRRGPAAATVATADFHAWDGQEEALNASGVRIYSPNASASQDLEPEYVATSTNSQTAWVTLQENNAVATVDLRTATVTAVTSLGLKDHSRAGNGLDASDRDGAVSITPWPVRGMYQPDAVDQYQVAGHPYLVTANEGDAREYPCFLGGEEVNEDETEEVRVKDLPLDPAAFPDAAGLRDDEALGRLNVTSTSPQGPNGYTELWSFGARSVTVRDAVTGAVTWDSGDALEQLTGTAQPTLFNANNDDNDSFDSRSDNKGPEPEGVDLGRIGGRTYAFVGLERQGGIVVVDVTDPTDGRIAGFASNRSTDPDADAEAGEAGDLGPEGVLFVPGEDSPTGEPLLVVGNEVSGTTTVWGVSTR